jgi:hypothetical protein
LRIIVDLIEFATKNVPQWNTISIWPTHPQAGRPRPRSWRSAADGFTHVEERLERDRHR